MRRVLLIAALLGSVVSGATAASGGQDVFVTFRMPSKNIYCGYFAGSGLPATLRCDIRSGLRPEPRGSCQLDWTGLLLPAAGRARPSCAGDTVFDERAPVLPYGRTWSRGGFTCLSSRIGLACANRAGYGFFLARERWQV